MTRPDPLTDRASTVKLALRLWRDYVARYWRMLLAALAATAIYAASASAIPLGVEWINSAFVGGSSRFSARIEDAMILGPVIVILLGLANAAGQYLQARFSQTAALAALRDLQKDMFDRLVAADFSQIVSEPSGHLISKFINDATVLREALARTTTAVRDALTLVALCAVMIFYDWLLFLTVAAIYAAIGWPVARIGRALRRRSGEAQAQAGDVAALVGESALGARTVKIYQLEDYQRARASGAFDRRFRILAGLARLRALNEPFIFLVGSIALAVVIATVAQRIGAGALDGPQFVSFIVALLLLSQPARGLGALNAALQEGLAAFERMVAIIDRRPQIADAPDAPALQVGHGAVSFRDVHFSYDGGAHALDGFSLDAAPGATVALVGESGAGKSTVFNLLTRLYEPQSGAIEIDGQSIHGATIASLRRAIATVSQDAQIFADTVRANIALGRLDATEDEIMRAARAADADQFIRALPGAYDAMLAEGGGNLSGGQRQRIALARAFLRDAPILLLDEATSALDAESEAKVQEAVSRLARGRTTLVIAHRLATVRNADLIAVMERGRIVEWGSHTALIEKGGAYARFSALQFRAD